MKEVLFFTAYFLLPVSTFAQWNVEYMRNHSWYFSSLSKMSILNFSSASATQLPLVDSTPSQNLQFLANRSFINDKNGRLLFYSNGSQIYDSTFSLMLNGDSITPNYNTIFCYINGVTILPCPNNDSLYYVFTISSDTPCVVLGGQYIYYSIVNMKANGGKGAVISKSNLLFAGSTSSGHLMPIRHGNGRDWWLLVKGCKGNVFFRFLLTPDNIQVFPGQNIGMPFTVGDSWQACFNSTGSKFAIISGYGTFDHDTTALNIYDFDRCTGNLSNPVQFPILRIDTTLTEYSISFAPGGDYLYWSNPDTVFQFNLITHLAIPVAIFDSTNIDPFYVNLGLQRKFSFYCMNIGIDNRIYIGTSIDKLHYINKPDLPGAACDVHQNAIKCPSGFSTFLFNVPSFYMQPAWGSGCDTVTAVSHVAHEEGIWLYPNPAHAFVNISFPEPRLNYEFKIQSAEGHIVYQVYFDRMYSPLQVNVSHLSPGLYFIELKDENGKIRRSKLIKE